ncbi:hypothetical protein KEM52_006281 [Ascosphaera acerosa]|nr:hypothetical protein KEM52_006281 [Ascosphaera acerosa]
MSEEPLTRIDSAVEVVQEPVKEIQHSKRRGSKTESGIKNIKDLKEEGIELQVAIETQKLNWKFNTPASSVEDKDYLKLYLVTPPVKKIDLIFPLGTKVTARNIHGVTIKDALDAMYKLNKKKADDELDLPYLMGFEWNKDENYEALFVHQAKQGTTRASEPSSKKSKKKAAAAAAAAE